SWLHNGGQFVSKPRSPTTGGGVQGLGVSRGGRTAFHPMSFASSSDAASFGAGIGITMIKCTWNMGRNCCLDVGRTQSSKQGRRSMTKNLAITLAIWGALCAPQPSKAQEMGGGNV